MLRLAISLMVFGCLAAPSRLHAGALAQAQALDAGGAQNHGHAYDNGKLVLVSRPVDGSDRAVGGGFVVGTHAVLPKMKAAGRAKGGDVPEAGSPAPSDKPTFWDKLSAVGIGIVGIGLVAIGAAMMTSLAGGWVGLMPMVGAAIAFGLAYGLWTGKVHW